jgi:hypothetical protein
MALNWKAGRQVLRQAAIDFRMAAAAAIRRFLRGVLAGTIILILIGLFFAGLIYFKERKEFAAFQQRAGVAGFEEKILQYKVQYIKIRDLCHFCGLVKPDASDEKFYHRIDAPDVLESYKRGFPVEFRRAFPQYFKDIGADTEIFGADCHEGRVRAVNRQSSAYEDYFYLEYLIRDERTEKLVSAYSGFTKGTCDDAFRGWTDSSNRKRYFVKSN